MWVLGGVNRVRIVLTDGSGWMIGSRLLLVSDRWCAWLVLLRLLMIRFSVLIGLLAVTVSLTWQLLVALSYLLWGRMLLSGVIASVRTDLGVVPLTC